jgi:hypothetical protein
LQTRSFFNAFDDAPDDSVGDLFEISDGNAIFSESSLCWFIGKRCTSDEVYRNQISEETSVDIFGQSRIRP